MSQAVAKESKKPFLTDIKTIRERARQHIQDGAVTESYGGNTETACKLLNEALATELVCVLRYKRHYYMAKGIHSGTAKAEFLEHAGEEQEHADRIAERIVQLGGIAEGTVRVAAARSLLEEYPLDMADGLAHVEAVAKALSTFGHEARNMISEADELEDADTADLFTEISRGIDKWLWFVEAHSQAPK